MTSTPSTDQVPGGPSAGQLAEVDRSQTADRLRRAGLRVTAQRLAVLQAVAEHPHSTADEVLTRLTSGSGTTEAVARPGISRQAVYDVLTAGVLAGLLRRIEPAGSSARYETRTGDNHHHLICRSCGLTVDVDCVVGTAPCAHPVVTEAEALAPAGFRIDEAEIVFWGRCSECQGDRVTADPSP